MCVPWLSESHSAVACFLMSATIGGNDSALVKVCSATRLCRSQRFRHQGNGFAGTWWHIDGCGLVPGTRWHPVTGILDQKSQSLSSAVSLSFYALRNTPFCAPGLSYDNRVKVDDVDRNPTMLGVVSRGGHSPYRTLCKN